MKSLAALSLVASLLFTGCSSINSEIKDSENRIEEQHLLDAGFKIVIADTKETQDLMNTLAPEAITRIERPEGVFYIYADPDTCACLYVGRDIEFQKLQQLAVDRQLSDQALIAHELSEDQQSGWGTMTPWGYWGEPDGWNNNPYGTPAWDPH